MSRTSMADARMSRRKATGSHYTPPALRTQILGAARAQRLADRFGLAGRVDLYHAFLVAATEVLRQDGLMGIITSNRFLTTQGGASIRSYLAREYDLVEIIDLGDTKLFEAAVLPAIFLGRRRGISPRRRTPRACRFMKVYSQSEEGGDPQSAAPSSATSVLDILDRGESGRYQTNEGVFNLTRGEFSPGRDPSQVWSLTTASEQEWLQKVRASSCGLFKDFAAVRVGVKTTADDVFIRSDWNNLPPGNRPEQRLLRPLLRHGDARRWSLPETWRASARVLYPHEVSEGCRRAVDLRRYPKAKAYLESNRERLERRHYVIEAGRQWYEIWVPQDPDGWACPKIVFPDISPEPCFYLCLDGQVVDGDCYWITLLPGVPPETVYLLLGVANSQVMSRYHDLAFNNKLYSGRRRYITQYVEKYPCPPFASAASQEIAALVREIVHNRRTDEDDPHVPKMEGRINRLVSKAFGLKGVEAAR